MALRSRDGVLGANRPPRPTDKRNQVIQKEQSSIPLARLHPSFQKEVKPKSGL